MNTNNQQVPCKTCILYAICKQRYRQSSIVTIMSLLPICSILYNYLNDGTQQPSIDSYGQGYIKYSIYKIEAIERIFKWKEVMKWGKVCHIPVSISD